MWTLLETRERLSDRLAEEGNVFWDEAERNDAINDAQRFIAAVTGGVPSLVTGSVDYLTPYISSPTKLLGSYAVAGWVGGTSLQTLRAVTMSYANQVDPAWSSRIGTPRWVLVEPSEDRIYFSPNPLTPIEVSAKVAVLPDTLTDDTDVVFNGEEVMEKYQGALLNFAAAMLLLKERYDGDSERFWQFAVQEMQMFGIDPAKIPKSPTPVTAPTGGE